MNNWLPFLLDQLPRGAALLQRRIRVKDYQRNCFGDKSGNGTRRESGVWGGSILGAILMDFRAETSRCPIRKLEDQTGNAFCNVARERERGRSKRIERKAIVEDKGEGYVETETLYL